MDYTYKPTSNEDDIDWIKTAIWCNKCAFVKDSSKSIESSNPQNFVDKSNTHAMVSLIMEAHPNIFKNTPDIVEKMNDVYFSNF